MSGDIDCYGDLASGNKKPFPVRSKHILRRNLVTIMKNKEGSNKTESHHRLERSNSGIQFTRQNFKFGCF
jgi:hypothetical protein